MNTEAHERARVAADELTAAGEAVTARAVREKAGVSMTVAAQIAREWKVSADAERATPEIPTRVQVRVEGLWKEAIDTARHEFEAERQGWQRRLEETTEERDGLIKDVATFEIKIEELQALLETTRQEAQKGVADLEKTLRSITSRADRAEAQVQALQEERDRLIRESQASQAFLVELAAKGAIIANTDAKKKKSTAGEEA